MADGEMQDRIDDRIVVRSAGDDAGIERRVVRREPGGRRAVIEVQLIDVDR